MDMKSARNTIIPIAVGLILAAILKLIGQGWGASLIVGAIVAIGVSILLQRQARSADGGGGDSAGGATSAADIDALLSTGAAAVSGFVRSATEIANPSTKEIAG
jgi:hypothetical protein